MSIAMIVFAPIVLADSIAHNPTGPAPITAIVSCSFISQSSAPQYPLDKISPTNNAFLYEILSGILFNPISAYGTLTYSA